MERKRVNGRFAKEHEVGAPEQTGGEEHGGVGQGGAGTSHRVRAERQPGAPQPPNCRLYTRARFAAAVPEVIGTLVEQAKKRSVAHLKLLVQISGLDRGDVVPRKMAGRPKSLERILMDEWKKEQEMQKADEAARG